MESIEGTVSSVRSFFFFFFSLFGWLSLSCLLPPLEGVVKLMATSPLAVFGKERTSDTGKAEGNYEKAFSQIVEHTVRARHVPEARSNYLSPSPPPSSPPAQPAPPLSLSSAAGSPFVLLCTRAVIKI